MKFIKVYKHSVILNYNILDKLNIYRSNELQRNYYLNNFENSILYNLKYELIKYCV